MDSHSSSSGSEGPVSGRQLPDREQRRMAMEEYRARRYLDAQEEMSTEPETEATTTEEEQFMYEDPLPEVRNLFPEPPVAQEPEVVNLTSTTSDDSSVISDPEYGTELSDVSLRSDEYETPEDERVPYFEGDADEMAAFEEDLLAEATRGPEENVDGKFTRTETYFRMLTES